ncbi:hypothetical protein ASC95_01225 [Pelomonas sp. Root1217]|uniref:hypothetical protein n=1 Tax=Pelomonas sp. Root1217 TaxID=1736430 RepID=UPI000708B88C|nr:hypothetical protein [Pelomonas sp. Root1217]KQV60128.1 hypothetical protein ASC95_01225 [Pelomonas sp. Root1217]
MEHLKTSDMDPLLTPREAAQRLLEEATKTAVRTGGVAGLRPVVVDGRRMFRFSDVDSFARLALAA